MPIEVKHGANPGAIGMAAFASGMNKWRNRQAELYMPLVRQQMAQQYEAQQRERGYQEQFLRDQWADQNRIEQDQLNYEQQLTGQFLRDERLADRQDAMEQSRYNRQMELQGLSGSQQMDREIMEGIRRGQMELAPFAQKRIAEITDQMARLDASDRFTEDEKQTLRERLQREYSNLLRSTMPKVQEQLTPMEAYQKRVYWSGGAEGKGEPIVVDPKTGLPRYMEGWKPQQTPKETPEDRRKVQAETRRISQQNADINRAIQNLTTKDPTTLEVIRPTPEQIIAEVRRIQGIRDQLNGGQPVGQAPQPFGPGKDSLEDEVGEIPDGGRSPVGIQGQAPANDQTPVQIPAASQQPAQAEATGGGDLLPRPRTPEEARQLHGTYFITPDGRRLWAP